MSEMAPSFEERTKRRSLKEVLSALFGIALPSEFIPISNSEKPEPITVAEEVEAIRYATDYIGPNY